MTIGCSGGNSQFADRATCMTACAAYPVTGNDGLTSGDNQECRQYHVMNTKRVDDPVVHCPHAGKDGHIQAHTCIRIYIDLHVQYTLNTQK
jgi:hypothetical protein